MTGSPWRPWEKFTKREGRRLNDIYARLEEARNITPGSKSVTDEEAEAFRAAWMQSFQENPPKTPPAFSPRHTYGGTGTIHRTGTIDIQQDETGRVVAVWFRCLNLPFTTSAATENNAVINTRGRVAIEEITYVDLPSEESSQ